MEIMLLAYWEDIKSMLGLKFEYREGNYFYELEGSDTAGLASQTHRCSRYSFLIL
jgi:hypothetical protein